MSDKSIHCLVGEVVAACGILREVGMALQSENVSGTTKEACRDAQLALRKLLRAVSYEEKGEDALKIKILQDQIVWLKAELSKKDKDDDASMASLILGKEKENG